MTEFTPGPWRADKREDLYQVMLPGGVVWLARGYSDDTAGAGRPDEDARLIAAAPELLAALEQAHESLSVSQDYEGGDLWRAITKALRRARGEAP